MQNESEAQTPTYTTQSLFFQLVLEMTAKKQGYPTSPVAERLRLITRLKLSVCVFVCVCVCESVCVLVLVKEEEEERIIFFVCRM